MTSRSRQAGLTLIELMIAMVIGLIVVAATTTLVVSLMRSNSESVRATRLSQELRAMADIASMELRRSRSLVDPLANVGTGGAAFTDCNAITPNADNSCVVFAYACNPNNGEGEFRAIRHQGDNLIFAEGTTAVACDAPGTQLNSNELVVDDASFVATAAGAIEMTLTGHLVSDADIKRTMTRVVWPRSAPVPVPATP